MELTTDLLYKGREKILNPKILTFGSKLRSYQPIFHQDIGGQLYKNIKKKKNC